MAESGQAKKHVFCSAGMVAGKGCKTLACALEVQVKCELGRTLPCS